MNISLTLAERLDDLVSEAMLNNPNVSAKTISKDLGIQESSLSAYRNGKKKPNVDTLAKIAKYFDVSTDWLLGLTDDPNRQPSAVEDLGLSPKAVQILLELKKDHLSEYLDFWLYSGCFHNLLENYKLYINGMHAYMLRDELHFRGLIDEFCAGDKFDIAAIKWLLDAIHEPHDENIIVSRLISLIKKQKAEAHKKEQRQMDFIDELQFDYMDHDVLTYKMLGKFRDFLCGVSRTDCPDLML